MYVPAAQVSGYLSLTPPCIFRMQGVAPTLVMVSVRISPKILSFGCSSDCLADLIPLCTCAIEQHPSLQNPTLQYVIYEWLRARLADRKAVTTKSTNRQKETTHEIFVTSALAKLGATLVTYPMLVVKSRLQVSPGCLHPLCNCLDAGLGCATGECSLYFFALEAAQHGRDASDHYHGMIDAIRKIYLQEGFRGFYNGMKTKILQSVLAAALLFMVKEKLTIAVRKTLRTENAGL